ncbi:MAG: type I glyceraldehyde-3-phosphate dehydrogenase [Enterobacterales bacterium]
MSINIGINGLGRIGRMILKEAQCRNNINIVAINDLLDINYIAYILKYDSIHGKLNYEIFVKNGSLFINGKKIRCTSENNPSKLNWGEMNIDIIVESTGLFLNKHYAKQHILSGAKKVIITSPPKDDIPMFVFGVNHNLYNGQKIISNASCTTNCLAPLAKVINDNFGIIEGLMTTVHAVTATQKTVDSISNKDWRGGRAAYQNIIPSSTGAAKAVGKIIPELHGKITGMSLRVPIPNVSVVDFTVRLKKSSSYNDICNVIKEASNNSLYGIMEYIDEHLVSTDFNGSKFISIFDSKASIMLNNKFIKLIAWYDNETGYSNKVLDLASYICK